jgi:hypothetical protein
MSPARLWFIGTKDPAGERHEQIVGRGPFRPVWQATSIDTLKLGNGPHLIARAQGDIGLFVTLYDNSEKFRKNYGKF